MKKTVKKISALVLSILLCLPMQILCVFAQETDPNDKIHYSVWYYEDYPRDEGPKDKIPVSISIIAPDLSDIDDLVIDKYGEYLEYYEYIEANGYVDYYGYNEQFIVPRDEYKELLITERWTEKHNEFIEEVGLVEENLIIDPSGVPDEFISVWLTKQEIYDIAVNEKVLKITYCDTNPPYPDIDYLLPLGDVNRDGEVNSMDVVVFQRYFVDLEVLSPQTMKWCADVNKDGTLTSIDVLEIMRYLAGYESNYLVGEFEYVWYGDYVNCEF